MPYGQAGPYLMLLGHRNIRLEKGTGLPNNTRQQLWPGLEPGPVDLESNTLTINILWPYGGTGVKSDDDELLLLEHNVSLTC